MSKKKGKMPAALRAYWANKRRKSRGSSSGSKAANSGGSSGVGKSKRKGRRRGSSTVKVRRRGFSGRSARGFLGMPAQVLPMIAGAAVAVVTINIVTPKLAAKYAWAQTPLGQSMVSLAVAAGGYFALRRVHQGFAIGFATGAAAVPAVGLLDSIRSKAGVSGLADLSHGVAGRLGSNGSVTYNAA